MASQDEFQGFKDSIESSVQGAISELTWTQLYELSRLLDVLARRGWEAILKKRNDGVTDPLAIIEEYDKTQENDFWDGEMDDASMDT